MLLQKSCDLKKTRRNPIVDHDSPFVQTTECLNELMAYDPNLALDKFSDKSFNAADNVAMISNQAFKSHENCFIVASTTVPKITRMRKVFGMKLKI